MTTLQKSLVSVVIAGAVMTAAYQAREASRSRQEAQSLRNRQEQHAALTEQLHALQMERDRATNKVVELANEIAALKKAPTDTLRLKGEVGRLRRENAEIGSSSPLSKVTANPEAVKLMRQQQKMGMGMIYKGFAQTANLNSDQTEKLNDLLADHIMTNVTHVTTCLRDKSSLEEIDEVFANQDAILEEQVRELLGEDVLTQFQDYTREILGSLSAEQFKSMMVGTDEEKAAKAKQLSQAIHEATQVAIANAGLQADFQTVPILNFRNIVSEVEADRSLKLLDEIYRSAAGKSGSFLSAEELTKFEEFRNKAIENSRGALAMNRSMMAPISN